MSTTTNTAARLTLNQQRIVRALSVSLLSDVREIAERADMSVHSAQHAARELERMGFAESLRDEDNALCFRLTLRGSKLTARR